ncbi:MAG: hypothetical protein AB7D03_03850 [Thiomicrospira sp.]
MTVKLNVNRTQWIDVPVPVGDDKFESFQAEMRILKTGEDDVKIVDLIVDVKDLEMTNESGRVLTVEETIEAIKQDHQLSQLVVSAWSLGNANIAKQQRTLLQPPERSAK